MINICTMTQQKSSRARFNIMQHFLGRDNVAVSYCKDNVLMNGNIVLLRIRLVISI